MPNLVAGLRLRRSLAKMSSDRRVTLLGVVTMAGLTAAAAAYPSLSEQVVRAHWAPTWADWLTRTTAWTPVSIAVAVALLTAHLLLAA